MQETSCILLDYCCVLFKPLIHEIRWISWQGLRYISVLVLILVAMKSAEFHPKIRQNSCIPKWAKDQWSYFFYAVLTLLQVVGDKLSFHEETVFVYVLIFVGSFGNKPMQSCFVWHVLLSLALSVSASMSMSAQSVYSCPSNSFDHRDFISYKYMHIFP